jgi:DNA repair photolyase
MDLIYEPKGKAREYAPLACNVYSGCDHACIYCYAPSTLHRHRDSFAKPSDRPGNFLETLKKDASKMPADSRSNSVLLSFTCDPYQKFDVLRGTTRRVIKILHEAGFSVTILTKGGARALRDIDLLTPRDAFATTLTTLDDRESLTWEPGAALPHDRIDAIRTFHERGIPTWVSLEPVIDPVQAQEIIRQTSSFVDLFKVGKLNYHPLANEIDWSAFAKQTVALLDSLGKDYYIKQDLLPYLNR